MELMDISLEILYKIVYEKGSCLPEDMIGYIAVSVSFIQAGVIWKVCFFFFNFHGKDWKKGIV